MCGILAQKILPPLSLCNFGTPYCHNSRELSTGYRRRPLGSQAVLSHSRGKMTPMVDVLTPQQRSLCMSRIRGKDTKPEILVRKGLFALGFRFRLHSKNLPGSPDLVLPKHRAVIFVHGCLWHGHRCHLFRWPQTNRVFWRDKINRNRRNDIRSQKALRAAGWRVLTIWECGMRGRKKADPTLLLNKISRWLGSNRPVAQL
jgi:DNA mismatch endonuclease, patch repair protein